MTARQSQPSSATCIGRSTSSRAAASRTTSETRTTPRTTLRASERIGRGGLAAADYVRRYLYKPPSDGYKKLEDTDSLDLACEALVADADKPYAHLFHRC
jgi:hypothetical protein